MTNLKKYVQIILILYYITIQSIDNPHFYRTTNMFLEPRLEHDYLMTFEATLSGGSTHRSRNTHNIIVPLFDIYGKHSIQNLTNNNPFIHLDNSFDQALQKLSLLPKRTDFATFSINGKFNILEANLSFAHNFSHGLFIFLHLPIRKLKISNIEFIDLSPDDSIFPNKKTPEWQFIINNFSLLFNHLTIDSHETTNTGGGDLSTYLGWTHNYQETKILDFIDFSGMIGFLAPTGKLKNEHQLFSLPTGYNGHWGFPICLMASIGFYEWVTIGSYLNSLFFIDTDKTISLKTDFSQSGIIKSAFGNVSEHRGPLITTGFYFKADHIGHGISITAAYSFASQQKNHIKTNNSLFSEEIINSDEIFKGWNMHSLNFVAEYDLTREDSKIGNRIGLFYNVQIGGSRVFNTNVIGGMYGLDIAWNM